MKRYITEKLQKYITEKHAPWHMPGHKRRAVFSDAPNMEHPDIQSILSYAMQMDVTEVPGLDDLHHPDCIIRQSMDELKKIYGAYESFYLVNGATSGILASIAACYDGQKGDILVASNCHKSVRNAVKLLGLTAHFIEPDRMMAPDIYLSVKPTEVDRVCSAHPNARAVVLTSPSYEGVISDIEKISKIAKKYNMYLIVDEAHGAHLPFMRDVHAEDMKLPESAIYCGADLVIQSLHKTLPSLTQTAVLHNQCRELSEAVRKYLSVFMSSSPSYIMLASMENAVAWMSEKSFDGYLEELENFKSAVRDLKHIHLLTGIESSIYAYDPTRLVFFAKCGEDILPGTELYRRLEEQGIVCEMAGLDYVVLISTVCDDRKSFDELYGALIRIDEALASECNGVSIYNQNPGFKSMSVGEYTAEINELIGKTAEKDIYVYPPGIIIVAAGEEITTEKGDYLKRLASSGSRLRGL